MVRKFALLVTFALVAVPSSWSAADCKEQDSFAKGLCFYEKKDYDSALPLIEGAALSGEKNAQLLLANMYQFGEGAPKNADKAIYWSERAFEAGVLGASSRLAQIYLTGKGNFARYAAWLEVAASEGDFAAALQLADFYIKGSLTEKDPCLARYWFSRASQIVPKNGNLQKEVGQKANAAKKECLERQLRP